MRLGEWDREIGLCLVELQHVRGTAQYSMLQQRWMDMPTAIFSFKTFVWIASQCTPGTMLTDVRMSLEGAICWLPDICTGGGGKPL